jgi:carbon-monoxide dehydrogenase large subunit
LPTIGDSVRRDEDFELLKGQANFVSDLATEPGTLKCGFLRSDIAHGELRAVDGIEEARTIPGVVGIFTASDLELPDIPADFGDGPAMPGMSRPVLARGRVRFHGEAVAAVVADTAYGTADALSCLWADVVPIEPILDGSAAVRNEPILFEGAGTNVVEAFELDSGEGALEEVTVRLSVVNQRVAPTPIEGLAIVVDPQPAGGIHVWCGHQAPHRLRRQLAALLGIREELVRVTVPRVGGAFGMKGMFFPEYAVCAEVARRLGRRTAWLAGRGEEILAGTHGRGHLHDIELAGDRHGRFSRLDMEITSDVGAYPYNGSRIPRFVRYLAQGPYRIPRLRIRAKTVVTNRAPTGSYRGAGRPEAAYALERAVDRYARAVGMDPARVRFLNFIGKEEMPYTTHTGAIYDGGDYARALETALELAQVDRWREEQTRRRANGGHPVGVGIGVFVERAGGDVTSGEFARTRIASDGLVEVATGAVSSGQAHDTVFRQIAASVLQLPLGAVRLRPSDTAETEQGTGSFASRSVQVAGSAVMRTAEKVLELAREVAADAMGVSAEDVHYENGTFRIEGAADTQMGLSGVARRAEDTGRTLVAAEFYVPGAQTFPYGAYVAIVEVDTDTGVVSILRFAAVDDCGVVVNPAIVEGQVVGSLVQGLGQSLFEDLEYDENGLLLTSNLSVYELPASVDVPDLSLARLETPAPSNPLAAKGSGEPGCIGAPPAIVNAVLDALSSLEVEHLEMPLRAHRIWEALRKAAHDDRRGHIAEPGELL